MIKRIKKGFANFVRGFKQGLNAGSKVTKEPVVGVPQEVQDQSKTQECKAT